MLLELLELLELRLAMPLFVGGAGLRMSAHEKFIARCYGLSLDLLAEAVVSAHGTNTACLGQSYNETHAFICNQCHTWQCRATHISTLTNVTARGAKKPCRTPNKIRCIDTQGHRHVDTCSHTQRRHNQTMSGWFNGRTGNFV